MKARVVGVAFLSSVCSGTGCCTMHHRTSCLKTKLQQRTQGDDVGRTGEPKGWLRLRPLPKWEEFSKTEAQTEGKVDVSLGNFSCKFSI